jgi:hypothetical protein
MDFIAKNNFIVRHATADHFDADFALFEKTFPKSRLIDSLKLAQPYNKKSLDERMLFELLDNVSAETVLNNRDLGKAEITIKRKLQTPNEGNYITEKPATAKLAAKPAKKRPAKAKPAAKKKAAPEQNTQP